MKNKISWEKLLWEKKQRDGALLNAYCDGVITKEEYFSGIAESEDRTVGTMLDDILPAYVAIGARLLREKEQ